MLRPNKISPKKPCPFCGAFLENEAPSTIWCHPRNSCLLSLRGIVGADQIAQWDTRYKSNHIWSKQDTRLRNVKRFGKILIRIFFLTKINR